MAGRWNRPPAHYDNPYDDGPPPRFDDRGPPPEFEHGPPYVPTCVGGDDSCVRVVAWEALSGPFPDHVTPSADDRRNTARARTYTYP